MIFRLKSATPPDEVSNLKEENDQLRCQLHAYENENELLKTENKSMKESTDKEKKMMQNMIKGKRRTRYMVRGKREKT